MRTVAGLVLGAILMVACGGSGGDRIVVAAGTTLVDSGLLDELVARYETDHPEAHLSIVGDASAAVIELGRNGAADLLVTHAPTAERAFIEGGHSTGDAVVLESRFVLLGPPDLVGDLAGLTVIEAFAAIAGRRLPFASRADGSGTFERETEIWAAAGVSPAADRLIETGQGMGLTLQVADQRGAFVLAEAGSYLTAKEFIDLRPVELASGGPIGDEPGGEWSIASPDLSNPYRAMVVAGGNEEVASRFVEWMLSPAGSAAIIDANLALFPEIVYAPAG